MKRRAPVQPPTRFTDTVPVRKTNAIPSVYWSGSVPQRCEVCTAAIVDRFYDAPTARRGAWALMCPSCFFGGPGDGQLGTGRGQEYTRTEGDRWLKTRG